MWSTWEATYPSDVILGQVTLSVSGVADFAGQLSTYANVIVGTDMSTRSSTRSCWE
jgi:hypothetical protein